MHSGIHLLHLHTEFMAATGATSLMLALLAGEAEGGAAPGAGAEDVVGGVGGEGIFLLAAEFGLEAEPGLVLLPALRDIAGKEAVHGEDEEHQRGGVQDHGDGGQDRLHFAEYVQNGSEEQEDQFSGEQCVIEAVRSVASVEEAGDFFTKFHTKILLTITFWHWPA